MSRFSNLELNGEFQEPLRDETTVKDEAYYLAQADGAFRSGRFETGLRAYAKVLEFNPDNVAAWVGQVLMLIELGEFKEANLWADKALERFPNNPELLAAKGVALARAGDLKAALAFSDAAIEERGESPYVWIARGDVLLARKEKLAEHCFERALSAAPADWFWRWLASRAYEFHRHFARALKLAREALGLEPGLAVIWLQVGACQAALGLNPLARHAFEQALQLEPGREEAEAGLRHLRGIGTLEGWLSGCWRRLFSK